MDIDRLYLNCEDGKEHNKYAVAVVIGRNMWTIFA